MHSLVINCLESPLRTPKVGCVYFVSSILHSLHCVPGLVQPDSGAQEEGPFTHTEGQSATFTCTYSKDNYDLASLQRRCLSL